MMQAVHLQSSAQNAVNVFGADLIGMTITTEPMGDWPGGDAVVTELKPDPHAPEIVCQVERDGQSIGVFAGEQIVLHGEEEV